MEVKVSTPMDSFLAATFNLTLKPEFIISIIFQACYSFDAGPNACIFLPAENVPLVAGLVQHFFPPKENEEDFFRGSKIDIQTPDQVSLHQMYCFLYSTLI